MYTPTQLEAIKIFGRKDLTDWCIITGLCLDSYWELKERRLCRKTYAWYYLVASHKWNFHDNCWSVHKPSSIEILWHEPHLEDVFRVAKEKKFHYIDITHLSDWTHELCFAWTGETDDECIPYNPTITLLEQSESTLQQIISLFE